ncbi:M23 family metallopeptidase [Desulfovibrio sp. SGI.169]|uniref:M23 family metallopeptidase n=1 Tax=Desulfovibrio sp. SGI.169 TaxID=3420561 RepID=UPI003CFC5AFE
MKSLFARIMCRLALCVICLMLGVPALAGVRLEAPARAARGDAFFALAVSDQPAECFVFLWRGKAFAARAELADEAGGQNSALWRAAILLPVPLDEKAGSLELGVAAAAFDGKADKVAPQALTRLEVYDKARPVQKLTVDKKYVNPPASQQERIRKDREKVRQALARPLPERCWTLPLARPVPGGVSSLFGMKRVFNGQPRGVHRGLDLRGASGAPVQACADGQAALVDNLYFSGNVVYINHGEGVFSAYLHLSEARVEPGERVRRGQVIGLVGATGRVTGPHLHLSLIVQGHAVDPQPLLAAECAPAAVSATSVHTGSQAQ